MQASAGQSSAAHAVRWHVRVFEPDHSDDGVLTRWKLERVAVLIFLAGDAQGRVCAAAEEHRRDYLHVDIARVRGENGCGCESRPSRPAPPLVCASDVCRLQSSANRPSLPSWFVPAEVLVLKINGVQVWCGAVGVRAASADIVQFTCGHMGSVWANLTITNFRHVLRASVGS